MSGEWTVPGWVGLVLLVIVALLVVGVVVLASGLRRASARAEQQARDVRAEAAVLRRDWEGLERRLAARTGADGREHVITMLGEPGADTAPDVPRVPAPRVPGPLFADLVLRESVVQAAAVAAGVRRALAPEQRHRIRLEMKREVKRARKQRRAEVRAARREVAARERGADGVPASRTDSGRAA